jgi:hypothetical protein
MPVEGEGISYNSRIGKAAFIFLTERRFNFRSFAEKDTRSKFIAENVQFGN